MFALAMSLLAHGGAPVLEKLGFDPLAIGTGYHQRLRAVLAPVAGAAGADVDARAAVEWVHATEEDIRFCRGCLSCLRDGASSTTASPRSATASWQPTPSWSEAPNTSLVRGLSQFFGRSVGAVTAKTSTVAQGLQPLAAAHDPRLPGKARALGRALVRSAATGRRPRARGTRFRGPPGRGRPKARPRVRPSGGPGASG